MVRRFLRLFLARPKLIDPPTTILISRISLHKGIAFVDFEHARNAEEAWTALDRELVRLSSRLI